MKIESTTDRREFFSTDDFAVDCLISGPGYSKALPVILNAISDPITLYDTNIETAHPHFICLAEDLIGFPRNKIKQCTATIDSKVYELERLTDDQDGYIATVYLKQ